jgi:hypothetical protein
LKSHGIKIDDEELEKLDFDGPQVTDMYDPRVVSMVAPRNKNAVKGALFADKDKSYYVEKYLSPSSLSRSHVLTYPAHYGRI